MKKILFSLLLIAVTIIGNAQTQRWTTDLLSISDETQPNLGTSNNFPLNFYTNNQKRVVIDTNGVLNALFPIKLGAGEGLIVKYIPRSSGYPAILSFRPGLEGNPNNTFFKPIIASCNSFAGAVVGGNPPTQYVDTVTTVNIFERMLQIQASQNVNASTALNIGMYGDDGIVALEPNPDILGQTQGVGKLKLNPSCMNDVQLCEGGGYTKIFNDAGVMKKLSVGNDFSGNDTAQLNVFSIGDNALNIFDQNGALNFRVKATGKTIIGDKTITSGSHTDALLTVNGKIVAKEVVATPNNWADFVFHKNYKLPTLKHVEDFYTKHGHLENIPSEKEVIENGINLGEMNKLLLQKIEESTIHIVELNKQMEVMSKIISDLQEKVKDLEKRK